MPFFRIEEGIWFWKSRRFDLGHLRNNAHQSTTLVAIDVGTDRQGIRDIGIARSLRLFRKHRILGLDRIERLHWGQQETVDEDCIEERVINLLRDLGKESRKELGLVLFSGSSELWGLAHFFPTASPLLSWWVDLHDVIADVERPSVSERPSLRDTMRALGLNEKHGISIHKSHQKSGNEALRNLAVLVSILHICKTGGSLHIDRPWMETRPPLNRKRYSKKLPRPHEQYPHVVKISMEERVCLSRELGSPNNFWDIFELYEPTAIGFKRMHRGVIRRSTVCGACHSCIYVCLPTRDMLDKLMAEYAGKKLSRGTLRLKDVSTSCPESNADLKLNESGQNDTKDGEEEPEYLIRAIKALVAV
jgi:hypothetical protein